MKTAVATMTSKGQVTIPKGVRDSLSVSAGDARSSAIEGAAARDEATRR